MAKALTVMIPWTPTLALSPNQSHRAKWVTANAKKEARHYAHYAALDAVGQLTEDVALPETVPYRIVVRWGKRRRHWDDDNLIAAMKASIDAICAVIGIDDKHLCLTGITQERDPAGVGETVFIFGEA